MEILNVKGYPASHTVSPNDVITLLQGEFSFTTYFPCGFCKTVNMVSAIGVKEDAEAA